MPTVFEMPEVPLRPLMTCMSLGHSARTKDAAAVLIVSAEPVTYLSLTGPGSPLSLSEFRT
jgi:hypothetical protein